MSAGTLTLIAVFLVRQRSSPQVFNVIIYMLGLSANQIMGASRVLFSCYAESSTFAKYAASHSSSLAAWFYVMCLYYFNKLMFERVVALEQASLGMLKLRLTWLSFILRWQRRANVLYLCITIGDLHPGS